VSQQSLSAGARLESDIGVKLFNRSTRRVTSTPAGEVLPGAVPTALDEEAGRAAHGNRA
jgi:DNA-binding transcriptional LysR family regulator